MTLIFIKFVWNKTGRTTKCNMQGGNANVRSHINSQTRTHTVAWFNNRQRWLTLIRCFLTTRCFQKVSGINHAWIFSLTHNKHTSGLTVETPNRTWLIHRPGKTYCKWCHVIPSSPCDARAQLTYREILVCACGRICWWRRFNVFRHRPYSWKDKGHSLERCDVTSGFWLRLQKCNWMPTDTILKNKKKKRSKLSPVPNSVDIFFKPYVCVCVCVWLHRQTFGVMRWSRGTLVFLAPLASQKNRVFCEWQVISRAAF